jgi:hypothetical protein
MKPSFLNSWDVVGINMFGHMNGKEKRFVSPSIHSTPGRNDIIVRCNCDNKVLDVVEASFSSKIEN